MKESKEKQQLQKALRQTWTLKPVTRVKESAKAYSRKIKHPKKDDI
jgi:hypothetical protein